MWYFLSLFFVGAVDDVVVVHEIHVRAGLVAVRRVPAEHGDVGDVREFFAYPPDAVLVNLVDYRPVPRHFGCVTHPQAFLDELSLFNELLWPPVEVFEPGPDDVGVDRGHFGAGVDDFGDAVCRRLRNPSGPSVVKISTHWSGANWSNPCWAPSSAS